MSSEHARNEGSRASDGYASLVQCGVRLRAFIRKHASGGCRLFSNAECQCPLCDADEVGGAINELRKKYDRDMDSIRAAMTQTIESCDTYSTIADKEDEARLDGMRVMLTLFDVQRRMCESR